jgi:site-specific recombinase XerD
MDSYGYSNVYAVNNYKHPFDGYAGESVLLLDEYSKNFRIQDMNNYLDGYPLTLPARYSNKRACYEKVFIISNLDLLEQYVWEQINQPTVWAAFVRRIHKVMHFLPDGTRLEYMGYTLKDVQEWLGHADIKVTADIYGHIDVARKRNMAASLASSLAAQ